MIKSTGIENLFVRSWDSWDGDQELLVFMGCTLRPEIADKLKLERNTLVDVDINVNRITMQGSCTVSLAYDSEDDADPQEVAKAHLELDGLTVKIVFEEL